MAVQPFDCMAAGLVYLPDSPEPNSALYSYHPKQALITILARRAYATSCHSVQFCENVSSIISQT